MALPPNFDDAEKYFEECIEFLKEYQYLYNYPNTEILLHNILDKITIENNDLNIFEENFDLTSVNDEYMSRFFKKLKRLQVLNDDFQEDSLEIDINVPLSPKKKHEIIYLAREINDMCENAGCDVVVDFGSGLGYLDQFLFETTSYKILGLECNENHYVGAKKRQRKYHLNSIANVKFIKHTVSENSDENIRNYLQDKFENHREFCITGLHACADLTIDAINLFLKMADAKAMVLMPCCYHKMDGNDGLFKNFPLSNSFKDIFDKNRGREYMGVPFLRLAAQPPSVDTKLEDLVFNLLSRAVLQLYAVKRNCKLKRNKRKAVKTKTMDHNFETYILDATTNGFTLIDNEPLGVKDKVESPTFDLEELKSLWHVTKQKFKKAGIYILLQNDLQLVIENLVLFDRLVYLKENGVTNCRFKKILNEKTSPRCLALLACK